MENSMRPILRRTRSASRGEQMLNVLNEGVGRQISLMSPSLFQSGADHTTTSSGIRAGILSVVSLVPFLVFHLLFRSWLGLFFVWIPVCCCVWLSLTVLPALKAALDSWSRMKEASASRMQTTIKMPTLRSALQQWRADFKHGGGLLVWFRFGLCL